MSEATTTRLTRSKSRIAATGLFLVVALTITYANHFDNEFHFDDSHTIQDNAYIVDLDNLFLFFTDARTFSSLPTNQEYRPVVTTLNAIDYWLGDGLDPFYFHLHIFIEFILLGVLLFFFFQRTFDLADESGNNDWAALFGAALFAFHTASAETINYIIARSDSFTTLCVIASFVAFQRLSGRKRHLGMVFYAIGILAKPTTLMYAPLLATYLLLVPVPGLMVKAEAPDPVAKIKEAFTWTAPYLVTGIIIFLLMRSMFSTTWSPSNLDAVNYVRTQPYVFWLYIKAFFLPTGLTADTDLTVIPSWTDGRVLFGLAVIALSLLLSRWAGSRRPLLPVSFGILWFYIALLPTSGIVPLSEVMNHHRTFFPYIGLAMSASWTAALLYRRLVSSRIRLLAIVSAAGLLILHSWGTYQRNEVWDTEESLWRDVSENSPGNGRGLMNYGLALMQKGLLDDAIDLYTRALDTGYGRHPYLHLNLAIALAAKGMDERAEASFRTALNDGPGYPATHYYYASWLDQQGRSDEAIWYADRAVELSPAHAPARKLAARLQTSLPTAYPPDSPEGLLQNSLEHFRAGRYTDCILSCKRALALRPDYALAYNNICSAYNQLEAWERAVEACEQALRLDPDFELARGNLEWARSRGGSRGETADRNPE